MLFFKLTTLVIAILFGIPSLIIDFKNRKKSGYHSGNEWAYYSKLSKEGSVEGKFMMGVTYLAISFIVALTAYVAYRLFTA